MERHIRWAGTAIVAVVLLAVGATFVGPASPASAERVSPAPSVRMPRDGQQLPARPAWVKLYLGSAKLVGAQLNGHQISDDLKGRLHGRAAPCVGVPAALTRGVTCKLRSSTSNGLRYGKNVLKARFKRHHKVRVRSVPFRVARHRPLAAAGRDTVGDPRQRIHLDGRPSLIPPKLRHRLAPSGKRAKLRYRWRLVDRPSGNHGKLTGAHTSRATLKLGRRGRYKVRLTVTAQNGRTGRDSVIVRSETQGVPQGPTPPPAMTIDTMAFENGAPLSGIKVGDTFYPPTPDTVLGELPWAQIVALKRDDPRKPFSEEAENYTIGCDNEPAACPEAQHELRDDLAAVGPNALVIVANPTPASGNCTDVARPFGLETALAQIGVSPTGFDQQAGGQSCGAISAVGSPGTKPGQGDWHSDTALGGGGMQGYLVRNNEKHYDFAAYDHIAFDTQAQGSSGSQNVIQVGDQKFTQTFPAGIGTGGGFQVVVLDAQTLRPSAGMPPNGYWFETDHSDKQALLGQLNQMQQLLHAANTAGGVHPKLVFIASLGHPAIQYYSHSGITDPDNQLNGAVKSLVDEVETLGGTRNAFYTMLDPALYGDHGFSYSLVSLGGSGPANGDEAPLEGQDGLSSSEPLNTVPLSGTLARVAQNYAFNVQATQISTRQSAAAEPTAGDPTRGAAELEKIALQQPTPWPEEDPTVFPDAAERARKQAAIKWIGHHVSDLSTNANEPRSNYWDLTYSEGKWKDIASAIQALAYPTADAQGDCKVSSTPGFCPEDLAWAKAELAGPLTTPAQAGGEIQWLIRVHRYLDDLSQPLADVSLNSYATVEKVVSDVKSQSQVSDTQKVVASNKAWSNFVLELIPELLPEKAATAAYVFNDIAELASSLAEINNEPVEGDFEAEASAVPLAFANRLDATLTTFRHQLPNLIAADYGKLRTVGSCLLNDSAVCPSNPADWVVLQDYATDAKQTILPATEAWAFGEMLPIRYSAWGLPPWWRTSAAEFGDADFGNPNQRVASPPFKGISPSAQMAKPIYRNMPTYSHRVAPVFPGSKWNWWALAPNSDTWSVTPLSYIQYPGDIRDPGVMVFPAASVTKRLFDPVNQLKPADGGLGVDPETFFDRSFTPVVPKNAAWCDDELQCDGQIAHR